MDVVVRTLVDTAPGRDGLVRARVEMPPGSQVEAVAGPGGELWYVIDGAGLLTAGDGPAAPIRRDTALWLPPGARYRLAASGADPVTLDSVTLPPGPAAGDGGAAEPALAELGDRPVEVTGDRRFRVLFGPGNGCAAATQFVGECPPGRSSTASRRAPASTCRPGSSTAWRTPGTARCGCSASSTPVAAPPPRRRRGRGSGGGAAAGAGVAARQFWPGSAAVPAPGLVNRWHRPFIVSSQQRVL